MNSLLVFILLVKSFQLLFAKKSESYIDQRLLITRTRATSFETNSSINIGIGLGTLTGKNF